MTKTLDLIGNEINIGDTVVSYNHIYKVLSVGGSYARIILANPSKTSRSIIQYSKFMVVINSLIKE